MLKDKIRLELVKYFRPPLEELLKLFDKHCPVCGTPFEEEKWNNQFDQAEEAILTAIRESQPSKDDITETIWGELCNHCDCENYPECPEGTDGCIADTIAGAIKTMLDGRMK